MEGVPVKEEGAVPDEDCEGGLCLIAKGAGRVLELTVRANSLQSIDRTGLGSDVCWL